MPTKRRHRQRRHRHHPERRSTTRLSRAIRDQQRTELTLSRMLQLVDLHLSREEPLAGVCLRGLEHLVGEPACPPEVDLLLERAAHAWPDGNRRNQVLDLVLRRCTTDEQRGVVWERRVQVWIDNAEAEATAVMRSIRLQQALATAEASGIKGLRERAAGLLQAVRGADREMIRFSASSRRYEEEFERVVDDLVYGESWHEALIRFGTFGPVTGDVDENRRKIERDHRMSPLGRVMPVHLTTPEGLPFYQGIDEAARFEVDLVTWEYQLIEQWLRPLAAALHEIPARYGVPEQAELGAFLEQWPGGSGMGDLLAGALIRYWCGDPNGAAFIIVPGIEMLVRGLVLSTNPGIYRLQKNQTPGQYPGLGALLPLLATLTNITESRSRFLAALLNHPAGMNLRNRMAHGYVAAVGAPIAAVLLHAALNVAALTISAQAEEDEPGVQPVE